MHVDGLDRASPPFGLVSVPRSYSAVAQASRNWAYVSTLPAWLIRLCSFRIIGDTLGRVSGESSRVHRLASGVAPEYNWPRFGGLLAGAPVLSRRRYVAAVRKSFAKRLQISSRVLTVPMRQQAKQFYAFGPFRVDSQERVLRRSSQPVALTPKAVDILLILVQSAGHLVDKDSLMKLVWPDAFVEEGNLTKNIFVLRKALGATEDGREYIETVPRRGYRFAVQVETWSEDEAPAQAIPQDLLRKPIPAGQGKVERIDRGKGYGLARQYEAIQEAPEPPAPAMSSPAAAPSHVPSYDAPPVGARSLVRRRLTLAFVVGMTALGVLSAVWFVSPLPAPRVLRTVQLTHSGRVDGLSRSVTDGTRLFLMELRGGQYNLAQVSISGGEPVPITTPFPSTTLLDISPDHSMLLVSSVTAGQDEGPIWVQPTTGGSPRRLGELTARDATWSPDGQTIVYCSGRDLYLARTDGSKLGKLVSASGLPHYPRWSPDGRVLRFTQSDPISHTESLWEVTRESKDLHPLFTGWRESPTEWGDGESGGDWTEDGKYFVFRSVRAHTASVWAIRENGNFLRRRSRSPILLTTSDLYLWSTSVVGKNPRIIFGGAKDERELQRYDLRLNQFVPYLAGVPARWVGFSKDGQWVAYVTVPGSVLWRSRLDGSDRLQLTFSGGSGVPRWSPDGAHIAFVVGPRICILSAGGGNPEPVTSGDDPEWSPDGEALLFSAHDAAKDNAVWSLQQLELKTRRVSQFPNSQGLRAPAYSPDGRYVAAISANPANRLMLFDVRAQHWTELAHATWLYVPPHWSRDSQYVYAQDLGGIDQPVFRVRISDHKTETVTSLKQFARADATAYSLAGLTPDGSPLASLQRSPSDIYALDVDFP